MKNDCQHWSSSPWILNTHEMKLNIYRSGCTHYQSDSESEMRRIRFHGRLGVDSLLLRPGLHIAVWVLAIIEFVLSRLIVTGPLKVFPENMGPGRWGSTENWGDVGRTLTEEAVVEAGRLERMFEIFLLC